MLITRKHTVTTLVSLAGFITVLLMNSAQAHSGHAPTQVHSHLGSPMMWLVLGVAALGLTAAALLGRKLWRQGRDARAAQKSR
ncbi:MAG: hypothetical protein ACQES7_07845 [Pseudomonadota bacterium]|jgi:hypothetical protein